MLRKVIWTLRAHNDRKEIFEYWNHRNKSNSYSLKLNEMLKIILNLICQHPLIGKKTNKENISAPSQLANVLVCWCAGVLIDEPSRYQSPI